MARKKRKSAQRQAYEKELNRIKRFIRSAEKRGYRFDKSIIPERPKRYTKKQVENLKELTATKLYHKATYLDPVTGKVVGGLRGRKLERQAAAKKGQETKRRKARAAQPRRVANASTIVLNNVRSLINEYPTAGAMYLEKILNREIANYGESAVARALMEAPEDMVALAQEIVFYISDSASIQRALLSFHEIITGTIPTEEELSDIVEVAETMEEYDDL